jgi:hypothetical protein
MNLVISKRKNYFGSFFWWLQDPVASPDWLLVIASWQFNLWWKSEWASS